MRTIGQTLGQLVLWRVVQGLGGGALIATSQAILRDTYPLREQGTAQGIFAMGVIVGPALGPVLGGWITDNWNWHWIFFINLPVGIVGASLIWNFLRNPHEPQCKKLDVLGLRADDRSVWAPMQFVLEQGQQYDWFDDGNIRLVHRRFDRQLDGLRLLDAALEQSGGRLARPRLRQVAAGSILGAVLGISLYGSIIVLPQYLQNSFGFTATLSGTVLLFRAAGVISFTPITAFLAGRGIVDVRISTVLWFRATGDFELDAGRRHDAGVAVRHVHCRLDRQRCRPLANLRAALDRGAGRRSRQRTFRDVCLL